MPGFSVTTGLHCHIIIQFSVQASKEYERQERAKREAEAKKTMEREAEEQEAKKREAEEQARKEQQARKEEAKATMEGANNFDKKSEKTKSMAANPSTVAGMYVDPTERLKFFEGTSKG